jgi:ribosome-associated protein YbcJ (S4-like RNA binding protein)
MAKIIIKLNNEVVDHVDLRQGDMKIGRKPGCEIVLDNLAVSGEHANVFTIGDDSFIQDLGSTNGTFINNKRLAKHHLRNGDTVVIGQHSLLYLQEASRPVERSNDEFAKTVVISPMTPTTTPITKPTTTPAPAAVKDATPAAGEQSAAALFVLDGRSSGRRIDITKSITNLGKTGRPAGVITRAPDGYALRTAGDDETPKVNGRTVSETGVKLRNGDIIEVAGTRLQFYLK